MGLFFNGTKLGQFTDTLSGGVNLLNNTLTMTGFNNMGNHSDNGIGFSIDPKEGYLSWENANEIKTNVFHVFAHEFCDAPVSLGQDIYLPAGTWTLSFLAKNFSDSGAVNTVSFFSDWCENQTWAPLGTSDLIDGVWKKHKITFKTNQGILHKNLRIHNTTHDAVPGGSLFFANLKLEAGSQATTYCPSYQDILAENEAMKQANTGLDNRIKELENSQAVQYQQFNTALQNLRANVLISYDVRTKASTFDSNAHFGANGEFARWLVDPHVVEELADEINILRNR